MIYEKQNPEVEQMRVTMYYMQYVFAGPHYILSRKFSFLLYRL